MYILCATILTHHYCLVVFILCRKVRIMVESKYEWKRVPEDSPDRCQALGGQGQCPFGKVEGSNYCPRHGGNKGAQKLAIESKRLYQIAKFQERIDFKANHPKVKSVTDELAVLRMTLEAKLNKIQDDQELVMQSSSITEMVTSIGKLAKLLTQIDKVTGESLDRNQAKAWVSMVISIISTYVTDPDLLTLISEDMMNAFDTVQHNAAAQLERN